MLEVYDRVIPSRSVTTLTALLILIVGLYAFSGMMDIFRGRVMTRMAGILDAYLSVRVASLLAGTPLLGRIRGDVLKPAQEADQIRAFLSGSGPTALFDLPWVPVYLAICFFLHPLIGYFAGGAIAFLLALTIISDLLTRERLKMTSLAIASRNHFGEAAARSAEVVAGMGLLGEVQARWHAFHQKVALLQRRTGDIAGVLSSLSKTIRQMVQSGSLALGAWLVIQGELTGGAIVAASIIVARTLQPIEQLISHWRNLLGARQAWLRLQEMFDLLPEEQPKISLPAPRSSLSVEAAFVSPPGERQRTTVHNVGFRANAGSVIGVIGPSASGKSSLARAITGVWPLVRGSVRLDGASLEQWSSKELGSHIGYMPQSSDLFPGSIAENIARLDREAVHDDIIAAAKAAGVHEMIVGLPEGYETQVGDGGTSLSAGQRQRIALARALFGNPFLVVLDEPNSNLDVEGDKALAQAISGVRQRGGIVVVVAHRNSILAQLDFLLAMDHGTIKAFGPRDLVLKSLQEPRPVPHRASATSALTAIDGDGA
jgi:PrtD family type I secretion system ABC transporter